VITQKSGQFTVFIWEAQEPHSYKRKRHVYVRVPLELVFIERDFNRDYGFLRVRCTFVHATFHKENYSYYCEPIDRFSTQTNFVYKHCSIHIPSYCVRKAIAGNTHFCDPISTKRLRKEETIVVRNALRVKISVLLYRVFV